jgi:uncharacterized protein involved in exopolysaccharide biosynthesis
MSSGDALTHLKEARASLQAQRSDIDKALRDIDRMLAELSPSAEAASNGKTGTTLSLRDAVVEALSDHRSRRASELHQELNEAGHDVTEGRLRAELMNMEAAGLVKSPGRGWYATGRAARL